MRAIQGHVGGVPQKARSRRCATVSAYFAVWTTFALAALVNRWALMLVMFGVGVGSLVWLTVLTGVMVLEKTTRWGHTLTPYVGVALILLGLLVLGY